MSNEVYDIGNNTLKDAVVHIRLTKTKRILIQLKITNRTKRRRYDIHLLKLKIK